MEMIVYGFVDKEKWVNRWHPGAIGDEEAQSGQSFLTLGGSGDGSGGSGGEDGSDGGNDDGSDGGSDGGSDSGNDGGSDGGNDGDGIQNAGANLAFVTGENGGNGNAIPTVINGTNMQIYVTGPNINDIQVLHHNGGSAPAPASAPGLLVDVNTDMDWETDSEIFIDMELDGM